MNARVRLLLPGLAVGLSIAAILWVGRSAVAPREEPLYQGKTLSYWVTRVGRIEEFDGAPKDAVAAIRAIGPKAVPFLLEWMPQRKPHRSLFIERFLQLSSRWFSKPNPKQGPSWDCVEIVWWALGSDGRSAIPTLARTINQPQRNMDDYSVWTESAKAISYLGPDAIIPMLTLATNLHGQHELWELLHNFQNLGTNGAPAVPALIHWARDPDYRVRDGVVSALGGIGQRLDLAVPILLTALNDSNSMVRRDAAAALGVFANDSEAVLPQLGPVQKLIPICPRKESGVPLRQSWVFEKVELGHHGIGDFDLSGVVLRIQGAFDLQTGLGSRFSNQAHNRWVIGQRLAGPVLADLAKESMLDRVPLGCSGGLMTDGHPQLVRINQFFLEGVFPEPRARAVAAAAIGQDEQLAQ